MFFFFFFLYCSVFFFNDPATTEIYTLSLHDALPIWMNENAVTTTLARFATPAVVTFFLAPVVGEVLSTATPLPGFLLAWLPLALLYGCGALLCRELALRWGTGWVGLLLLGAAYGIIEEGLIVRSFFDPAWRDLGELGIYGRSLGVNWLWTLLLIIFHMAVSIGVTIGIVEMLFPGRKHDRWLGRRGMVASSLILLGICGLGFFMYSPPPLYLVFTALVVLGLGIAAKMVTYDPRGEPGAEVPRPRRFFILGLLAIFGRFFATGMGAVTGVHATFTALVMTAITAGSAVLALRWSGGTKAWDDRHRLALIAGIIAFLSFVNVVTLGVVGVFTAATAAGALLWMRNHLNRRHGVAASSAAITVRGKGSASSSHTQQPKNHHELRGHNTDA